jgi:hypothetical protein
MLPELQELVCMYLVKACDYKPYGHKLPLTNFVDALTGEDAEAPSGELMVFITQPKIIGMLALVSKTLHQEIKKQRRSMIQDALVYLQQCAKITSLELTDIDQYLNTEAIPDETYQLYNIFLGSRCIYSIVFLRCTKQTPSTPDDDMPHELVVKSFVHTYDDTSDAMPQRASVSLNVPLHRLCWVHGWDFHIDDHDKYNDWQDATSEALGEWFKNTTPSLV